MRMKKTATSFGAVVLLCAGALLVIYFFPGLLVGEDWIETQGRIVEIKYALEDYRADHGAYPTQEKGLSVLLRRPPEDREGPRYFIRKYVLSKESLSDAWDRSIVYEVEPSDGGCVVYSLGRDGKPGGGGADEDIRMVCHPEL